MFQGGQPRPPSQGRLPSVPNFGTPTYAHTIWPRATKFGVLTCVGQRVSRRSAM